MHAVANRGIVYHPMYMYEITVVCALPRDVTTRHAHSSPCSSCVATVTQYCMMMVIEYVKLDHRVATA